MTKLRFTHEKGSKNSCYQNDAVEEKKTLEKTVCTDNDKKNCLSPKKFYSPPPPKKIMVLIPYLLTTSIAFNFVFKKAKASNKLHAVLHVSSMKQTL